MGLAVVVHHLASAVGLGRGVLDVVPMHVAGCADLGQARRVIGGGGADGHLEVLEDHAVAICAREGEGDALLAATGDAVGLHGAGGGVLVALVGGEGEAVGVAAIDDAHLVTFDDVARGSGEGVGGRASGARHQLEVGAVGVHIVGVAREGQFGLGRGAPHLIPGLVGRAVAVVERTRGGADGIVEGGGRLYLLDVCGFVDVELATLVRAVLSEVGLCAPVVNLVVEASLRLVELHLATADDVATRGGGITERPSLGGARRGGLNLRVVGADGVEIGVVLAVDDVVARTVVAVDEFPHGLGLRAGGIATHHACGFALGGDVVVGCADGVELIPMLVLLGGGYGHIEGIKDALLEALLHLAGLRFVNPGIVYQIAGFCHALLECCHLLAIVLSHAVAHLGGEIGMDGAA